MSESRGSCFAMSIKKGANYEHIRLSGDKAPILEMLQGWEAEPSFELVYHEPLAKVFRCWTVRLTVLVVSVADEESS